MFDESGGIVGCLGMIGLIIALVVVGLLAGGSIIDGLQDSAASANRAAASLEQARAERERAIAQGKVELEQARAESWEHRYILWTSFIEANDDDAPLIVGALLAAVLVFAGLAGGYTLAVKLRTG